MNDALLGAFPKNETAEIRIMKNEFKGRHVLDIRLWYIPQGGGEMVPSHKGLTFDFTKTKDLARILNEI